MRNLKEFTIKKIGEMTALPKSEKEHLSFMLKAYDDFPAKGSLFQLGDFVIAFPTRTALREMRACEWGLVTDLETNEPLALVPNISFDAAERLYKVRDKRIYVVTKDDKKIYCGDYPNFSYRAESVWIPLGELEDDDAQEDEQYERV